MSTAIDASTTKLLSTALGLEEDLQRLGARESAVFAVAEYRGLAAWYYCLTRAANCRASKLEHLLAKLGAKVEAKAGDVGAAEQGAADALATVAKLVESLRGAYQDAIAALHDTEWTELTGPLGKAKFKLFCLAAELTALTAQRKAIGDGPWLALWASRTCCHHHDPNRHEHCHKRCCKDHEKP